MAESKITFAKIKDKVTGNETAVNKLLFTDRTNKIKSLYPSGEITVDNATKLNGETKEQLLQNLNATTIGGKTLSQIQSRGKFGFIRLITDDNNAAHHYQMFAVNEDEELIYWGYNASDHTIMAKVGETAIPFVTIEHPLRGKSKIKQITQNVTAQFLLYENGDLYGRGYNAYYNLGIGNTAHQYNWVKITDNVKKLCPGHPGYYSARACEAVIKNDGSVWFWGENAYGHAGMGNTTTLQVPTKLALTFLDVGDEVKDLVLNDGYYTSAYLITKKGKLYVCGENSYGQLGLNDTAHRSTFQLVSTLQDEKVLEISHSVSLYEGASYFHEIAIAKCEGNKFYITGETGNDFKINKTLNQVNVFTKIENSWFPSGYNMATDPLIECFTTGNNTIFYLTKSGRLFNQGYNSYGQSGVGTTSSVQQITEVKIDGQPNAKFKRVRVSCPAYQPHISTTFADVEIGGDISVYSWGHNAYGQAGANSALDNITKPTRFYLSPDKTRRIKQWCINGYTNSPSLFILLDNGQVYGWGYNNQTQVLGNGSTITPITFPTLIL
nr:MAG TPA: alpha-tubulin suppressor [Caudoviricetes sp.]